MNNIIWTNTPIILGNWLCAETERKKQDLHLLLTCEFFLFRIIINYKKKMIMVIRTFGEKLGNKIIYKSYYKKKQKTKKTLK